MQMKLFLSDSIYADLCDDILYMPSFILENSSWFLAANNVEHQKPPSSTTNEVTIGGVSTTTIRSDMDSLVRFLLDHVSVEMREDLKCLLDLDSVDGCGENIDEFGRKELPFPVITLNDSSRFSLIVDYNYAHEPIVELIKSVAETTSSSSSFDFTRCLWYRREICRTMILFEQRKNLTKKSIGNTSSMLEAREVITIVYGGIF